MSTFDHWPDERQRQRYGLVTPEELGHILDTATRDEALTFLRGQIEGTIEMAADTLRVADKYGIAAPDTEAAIVALDTAIQDIDGGPS